MPPGLLMGPDVTENSKSLCDNEQPRCKQRGINRKILNATRGGELNPCPTQAD